MFKKQIFLFPQSPFTKDMSLPLLCFKCKLVMYTLFIFYINAVLVFIGYHSFSPSQAVLCQIANNNTQLQVCEIQLIVLCTEEQQQQSVYSRDKTFCGLTASKNQGISVFLFGVTRYAVVDGSYPVEQTKEFFKSNGYLFLTDKEWDDINIYAQIMISYLCTLIELLLGRMLYHKWRTLTYQVVAHDVQMQ